MNWEAVSGVLGLSSLVVVVWGVAAAVFSFYLAVNGKHEQLSKWLNRICVGLVVVMLVIFTAGLLAAIAGCLA